MFQVPWRLYSEPEILEVLTEIFRDKGYDVYNIHKTDRRGEEGVDMECTKPAETEKVLLAVKKKPEKSDVGQLEDFAKKASKSRIYVYIEEPSRAFKSAMEGLKNRVSFWSAETLTHELFCTDLRFYLFMILENSFEKTVFELIQSFFDVFFRVEKKKAKQASKANSDMLSLLWVAKDRSSSLHKSLRTLQEIFEKMSLSEVDEETRKSITNAFLTSIEMLKCENLEPLQSQFSEFLNKYPNNFEQFCKQTRGRSNWRIWASIRPTLSPRFLIGSLESTRESTKRMKKLLDKRDVTESKPSTLSEILGDVSRILANEVDMFEDTVDDLFSIGLFGKWDDMREEFARMSCERSKELKDSMKKELNAIKEEIAQNLKNASFQSGIFSDEIFVTYSGELKQHLCLNDFMLLQKAYSKVIALRSPSNLPDVNKRGHEEAMTFVDRALVMLDSRDIWDDLSNKETL